MKYTVEFSNVALKELKKLDKPTAALIIGWIEKNLKDTENPFKHGKELTANLKGCWRYRVGNYRIICEIQSNKLVILVLRVGHRREIYDKIYKI